MRMRNAHLNVHLHGPARALEMRRNVRLLLIQLALCLAGAFLGDWLGLFDHLETGTFDWRASQWRRWTEEPSPLLVAAEIDMKAEELTRPFPAWKPSDYLDALTALQDAGCKGVYIAVERTESLTEERPGAAPWSSIRIPIYLAGEPNDAVPAELPASASFANIPRLQRLPSIPSYIQASPDLKASFSGACPDLKDGMCRLERVLAAYERAQTPRYSIEAHFAADALGIKPSDLGIPLDHGMTVASFLNAETPVVSMGALLADDDPEAKEAKRSVRGKWAVLGLSPELGMAEKVDTAFEKDVSAFQVRVGAVNALITGKHTLPKTGWVTAAALAFWFAALIPVGWSFGRRLPKPRWIVLGGAAAAVVHLAASLALFRWVWIPFAAVFVGLTGLACFWSVSVNAAQTRQAERRALQAEREAAFSLMTSQVRHEIRNALNSIRSPAEMLQRNFSKGDPLGLATDPEEIVKEMERIISHVTHLSDMVEDELGYLHSQKFLLTTKTDIWTILLEARAALSLELEEQSVTVKEEAPEERLQVMADPEKLRAAFVNLIRNAAQAMPNGGVLRLSYLDDKKGAARVRVADTGVGMSPKQMERAFDPFYTTKARGLGVGLVTVKRIVESHRGKVDVKSKEGKGTSFEVTLPEAP